MFESKSRQVGKSSENGPKMIFWGFQKRSNPFISIFPLNTKNLNAVLTFHENRCL